MRFMLGAVASMGHAVAIICAHHDRMFAAGVAVTIAVWATVRLSAEDRVTAK